MNAITALIPDPRYRQLDEREERLKRELETVRAEKQQIAQKYFFGSASKETTDDMHSAIRRTGASTPAREPLILHSTLP